MVTVRTEEEGYGTAGPATPYSCPVPWAFALICFVLMLTLIGVCPVALAILIAIAGVALTIMA
jgi:hypothetical protein